MESMFLWIVLFSAAAVLLLGLFLVASEKELKKKRGEINELLTRLEGAPAAAASAPNGEATVNGSEVTGLRAKNQELQTEMAALQDDLDAAHRAIDELRATAPAAHDGAPLAEIQQLRGANAQLGAQIEELRCRLEASEAQLRNTSVPDSANERQIQLENSLIELKHQLEKSKARIRELESSATPTVDVGAIEAKHKEDSQKLHSRIAELENRLGDSADMARQVDAFQQRIRNAEQLEQELRAALRRREEEVTQWQERLAASEELKKRLVALQPVYDQLVAKQNSLIEHQREYHGELKSFAQFLSASHDGTIAPATYFEPRFDEQEARTASSLLTSSEVGSGSDAMLAQPGSNGSQVNGAVETATKTKRGFGVFHAVIALVVGAAIVALFLSQSGEQPVTHAAKPLASSVPERAPARIEQQTPAPQTDTPAVTASLNQEPAIQKNPAKQAKGQTVAAVAGTYEVTRSTRVFAAPTEFAQQVGEIEPGLKVNVVNARDGWLEIHSKHGRPPGFIRSDAVARVGG
jgi:hypothetical protein